MAYLPLSTANLPDPIINPAQGASPEDHFGVALYTGNGTSTEVSTLNFQPDFVWGKKRSAAGSHFLLDAIRGVNSTLSSDTTSAEDTSTDIFTSFDSDGFTVGANGQSNSNGVTYVAWNWKANGSGVSNTDGSITSTVSANTTSGFSIVSYTGTGANATVGHGLDSALDMLIVKNRDRSANWHVWHNALTGAQFLELSSTAAAGTDAPSWNSTVPTSTVFSVGTSNATNASGENLIAYCFHSVEGFSKFGSYVGNGSTDGPFVYTGFQVKWVMYKRTDSAGDWSILDTERSTYNVADDYLYPHSSAAEASGAYQTDFLSNGFKLRGTNTQNNASGGTYIYMAFAENPFKYSNAR